MLALISEQVFRSGSAFLHIYLVGYHLIDSSSFSISAFTLRPSTHLELLSGQEDRDGSHVNLLYVVIQISQHHLLKMLYFLQSVFLTFLPNIRWLYS